MVTKKGYIYVWCHVSCVKRLVNLVNWSFSYIFIVYHICIFGVLHLLDPVDLLEINVVQSKKIESDAGAGTIATNLTGFVQQPCAGSRRDICHLNH